MYFLIQKHSFPFSKKDIVFPPCVVWRRSSIFPFVTIAALSVHFLWWRWNFSFCKGSKSKKAKTLFCDEISKYGSSHVNTAIVMSACADRKNNNKED